MMRKEGGRVSLPAAAEAERLRLPPTQASRPPSLPGSPKQVMGAAKQPEDAVQVGVSQHDLRHA
jgi:hypothetical protein